MYIYNDNRSLQHKEDGPQQGQSIQIILSDPPHSSKGAFRLCYKNSSNLGCMQESPDLLHYASNTEQKSFSDWIFNSVSVIVFQFVIVSKI